MAFKITKQEGETRDGIIVSLEIASTAINAAILSANELINEELGSVNDAIDAYNEVLAEAREFAEGVAARLSEEFSDKSEKWQESERGRETSELVSEWENMNLDDVDEIEVEQIEEFDADHQSTLENSRDAVEA